MKIQLELYELGHKQNEPKPPRWCIGFWNGRIFRTIRICHPDCTLFFARIQAKDIAEKNLLYKW